MYEIYFIYRAIFKEIIRAKTDEVTCFIAAPIIIELRYELTFEIFINSSL